MQVTHTDDHTTHAVISANETMDMGISSSAEFFHILSSTLYTDQKLAVVRETLCNAWDAHIEAGKQDTPIEITLNADTFIIKDFGNGIPKEKIQPIYGVYGGSTKKNDGKQTGGFGLGCKAPFAYVDHFEVTSCNAGTKTLYRMSKSSGQVAGKPGITPILSIPTTESGITVSLKIQRSDIQAFRDLINRIVQNGSINAMFNGFPIKPKYPFDECKKNYLITLEKPVPGNDRIFIRYGNVIYPINENPELETNYALVVDKLKKLSYTSSWSNTIYSVILFAPPHSIAVTPSREALSYQAHTLKTINELLVEFLNNSRVEKTPESRRLVLNHVKKLAFSKRYGELMPRAEQKWLPVTNLLEHITNMEQMASVYLQRNYVNDVSKAELRIRLDALCDGKVIDRGLMQSWLRHHEKKKQGNWVMKVVIAPLLTKIKEHGVLKPENFLVSDPKARNTKGDENLVQAKDFVITASQWNTEPIHYPTLPYTRKFVLLVRNRQDLYHSLRTHPDFENKGPIQGFLIYNTMGVVRQYEAAKLFFAEQGYQVIDAVPEQEPVKVVVPKEDKKPVQRGMVRMNSMLKSNGFIDTTSAYRSDAPRITDPEFVLFIGSSEPLNYFKQGFNPRLSKFIVQNIGDKGGIAKTTNQIDRYKEKGAWDYQMYLAHWVCDQMNTNPRIREYWSYNFTRLSKHISRGPIRYSVLSNIYETKVLHEYFGLVNNMTKEDELFVELWDKVKEYSRYEIVEYTIKSLEAIPFHKANLDLYYSMADASLANAIHFSEFEEVITKPANAGSPKAVRTLQLLINIIKG